MDVSESIVSLIIETAKERSHALSRELEIATERQYPSSGPLLLIRALQRINESVASKLKELESNEELGSALSARQFHQHVNRVSKLLPYLHELLGLLDGAEIKDTPSPFVPSLLRLIRKYLPDAELVLASKTSLNYSFEEIGKHLRTLLSAAGLDATPDVIPEHFLVITFPRVEAENVLLHCVIAHEIGHGLYQKSNLRALLLPLISIEKQKIDTLVSAIFQAEVDAARARENDPAQLSLYPSENEVKARITRFMNDTASNWLEELCSDAIGLTLFGPAYFFAIIHLVVSFQLIDNPSPSHPPNTLRIRLLLLMLGTWGKNESTLDLLKELPPDVNSFIDQWKAISIEPPPPSIFDMIIDPITRILERIGESAKRLVGTNRYPNDAKKLVDDLSESVLNCIPPNELRRAESSTIYPDIILILNAGWNVLMCDMIRFAQLYGGDYKADPLSYKSKLNELVLKAVELDNFRIVWDENVQVGSIN